MSNYAHARDDEVLVNDDARQQQQQEQEILTLAQHISRARSARLVHRARASALQVAHHAGNAEARERAHAALLHAGDAAFDTAAAYTTARHAEGRDHAPDDPVQGDDGSDAGPHGRLRDARAAHEEARLLAGHLAAVHESERGLVWAQAADHAGAIAERARPSDQSAAYHRAHAEARGAARDHLAGTRDHAARWHDAAHGAHADLQSALTEHARTLFTHHLTPTHAELSAALPQRLVEASADYLAPSPHDPGQHAHAVAAQLLAGTPFCGPHDPQGDAHALLDDLGRLYGASTTILPGALALQQAAAREFSLSVPSIPPTLSTVVGGLTRRQGPTWQATLRALYAVTQADLAGWNMPGLVVYRALPAAALPRGIASAVRAGYGDVSLDLPLSSWTGTRALAEHDARAHGPGSVILAALAPRTRILASARTGLGDPATGEVILLGGAGTVRLFSHGPLPEPEGMGMLDGDESSMDVAQ